MDILPIDKWRHIDSAHSKRMQEQEPDTLRHDLELLVVPKWLVFSPVLFDTQTMVETKVFSFLSDGSVLLSLQSGAT